MDYQTIINVGAGAALAVMGWFARELWGAVGDLRADLSKLREELPKTYATKDDFKTAIDALSRDMKENFTRLFDKLDKKADK